MDIAWDLNPKTDLPRMDDGSAPSRVPLPVFARLAGWQRTDYYSVYSILQMFCDVSHEWSVGPETPPPFCARHARCDADRPLQAA
jgi:hypothetical protein